MSIEILQSDAKRAVSRISGLTIEELDAIMEDDSKIEAILDGLDQSYLKEIQNEKENLMASNNSMAEYNLSKEPELADGREKIRELSEAGEELTKKVEEKTRELRDKGGDMSIETALALLQTAASEMEEESDKVAKKFLDNEMDSEEFLDQFLIKRQLTHTRLVKAEKLSKIFQRDPTLSNIPNYINSPPTNINTNYFPGVPSNPNGIPYPVNPPNNVPYPIGPSTIPYPTGPLNMPMPPAMNYFQNHY